jgi:hypothetical protein
MKILTEIVGAKIGTVITNDYKHIQTAARSGLEFELLDRGSMKFMAACGTGRNWDIMANGPTLFLVDENGVPHRG